MTKIQKISLLVLRMGMAWLFFYSGLSKVLDPKWTAKGYLLAAKGPLAGFFHSLAGNQFVDFLNMWGLTLIGLSLALGILLRFVSFWGIILMILYYLPIYPPLRSLIVDDHIIYILVFIALSGLGAGRFFGLDGLIEEFLTKKGTAWSRFLLG